jgi:hypothetical protein
MQDDERPVVGACGVVPGYMVTPVGILKPMLGRKLRKEGKDRGTVDEHGLGVTCSNIDGELKKCHDAVKFCLQREAKRAAGGDARVQVEVFGVFTRVLRDADVRRCG